MSTHNICFCGEIRKISVLLVEKSPLSGAMTDSLTKLLLIDCVGV